MEREEECKSRTGRKREGGWAQQRQTEKARETDREQTGSMSSCLEGGAIPPSNRIVTSNSVLMRLRVEDKNK